MSISLEQLSAQMRRGEQVPLRHTMQVVLTLSIPSILQQIVVTAVEYIDAAMVGHIGASATASIGIVSSSTWLMHGMLAGLYMSFAIQVAQYLGADRQDDARGVLRQSMIFNLVVGLAAAAFGIGISRFLPATAPHRFCWKWTATFPGAAYAALQRHGAAQKFRCASI